MLLVQVCLRFLLLVRTIWLLQRVRSDTAMELALTLLLLLSLYEGWYLRDHIRRWTGSRWGQLAGSCRRALPSSLGDKALRMQVGAHYRHARVLAHLRRVALKFTWETHAWGTAVNDTSRHAKIRSNSFVAHDVLLRNIAKLSVVGSSKSWMRGKLLFQRSFPTAETTSLLPLTSRDLCWIRSIARTCVV